MAQYAASRTEYAEEEAGGAASPIPLGAIAFALTTALLGASFAHFLVPVTITGLGLTVPAALFFGGVVQILAGLWAFRRGMTLPATIFSAYGGFLLAFGALFTPSLGLIGLFGASVSTFNHALGLLFLCWTISCAVLVLGALRSNMVLLLVMVFLFLAFLFLTIGEFANANFPLLAIGGWLAIICSLIAWYAALGSLLQSTRSTVRLPMWGERGMPTRAPERGYGSEPAV
jgi:succinate-acetate transporter protein